MEIAPARRVSALLAVLIVVLVVLAWVLGSNSSRGAAAAVAAPAPSTDRARDGVLVSGIGLVEGRPDVLTVQVGIETRGSTVDAALNLGNRALGGVRDAFTKGGVAERDLKTSGLSIYPQFDTSGRRISGYQVDEQLSVKLRDLANAGRLISLAADAGGDATRINSLSFDIEDDSGLLVQARKKAFDEAKAKAELYAEASGRGLGRVVSVNESVSLPDFGRAQAGTPAALDSKAVPVLPGQQQLSVTVTVEWAFS